VEASRRRWQARARGWCADCADLPQALCQFVRWGPRRPPNRVGAGLTPAPPTPPDVRVRIRRFASHPGNGDRDR
jgi:hypothetical protein